MFDKDFKITDETLNRIREESKFLEVMLSIIKENPIENAFLATVDEKAGAKNDVLKQEGEEFTPKENHSRGGLI